MNGLEETAKVKLAKLVKMIEPVVETQLAGFTTAEINFVLSNYKKFLSYDLSRDFEKAREKGLKESPFDDLLDN